ncbi:MAG: uracil-DNA glycosylase [Hyphomicrobiaceae bacterium]
MNEDSDTSGLTALLAWWREAGVDVALDDQPIDWSLRPDQPPGHDFAWPEHSDVDVAARGPIPAPAGERPAGPRGGSSRPPGAPSATNGPPSGQPFHDRRPGPMARTQRGGANVIRSQTRQAETLGALEAMLRDFDGCPLKTTAKNLCFYRGNPDGRVMVIGEAPGRDEDLAGKPFVGRAGQLLDRMLAAIALSEADVHITNIVYWRPPGNRTPTPEEAASCRPFLERQMELVKPDLILTLGGPAAKAILDASEGIMRLRGKWRTFENGGRSIPVMATLHPAYLLRQPAAKQQAWRDLLALRTRLDETTKGRDTA